MTAGRILDSPADIAEGAAALGRSEPRFAALWRDTGPWPLRRRAGGFAGLFSAIVGQQVSVASAAALWARLEAAGLTEAGAVCAAGTPGLLACGLSRPKARYGLALAQSGFDFAALAQIGDAAVVARLTELPGVGPWTAEIYAAFCLGRADVLPAGDLALQEAARVLFALPARPDAAGLRAIAAPWAPWRGVAARGLWAYYRVIKTREGIA